jgi:hypothetical protein
MMKVRAILVIAVGVAVLLCGCGSRSTGAGPTSVANPQLRTTGLGLPPESAAAVARSIAARWAATGTRVPRPNTAIEFRAVEYTATVFNPGSLEGFTAFITTRQLTLVTPASAATIDGTNSAAPRFATPADQALWQAAGRPSLGQAPATGQTLIIPAGGYSFLSQGTTLTYRQAAALPPEPGQLTAVVLDHLRPYAGSHPPASLELTQLSYLIATAPLTDAARAAAWQALASLPGLRTCQTRSDQADPRSIELCIASTGDETLVSVDFGTGAIRAITDRLLRPSVMYPHVHVGTVVESSTFLAA